MKLFVGLGNPGGEYVRHRHNVGFIALDRIAEVHGLRPWRKRFNGVACEGLVSGRKVMLLKPQTYMNESGRSVGEAQRYLKIAPGDVIVFHDELDLAPGKIKFKTGGGNAGHNGLRSITAHIGNEYARVRIGIGHPGSKDLVHGYVLHDFAKADQAWLEPLLEAMAQASGRLAAGDEARFLTDVARATRGQDDGDKGNDKTGNAAATPKRAAVKAEPSAVAKHKGTHPAGERQGKRAGALAENLKRWLSGRRTEG